MPELYAVKTWYSAEDDQFITLADDVLGIVRQVREKYGKKVTISLDPVSGVYHFVGHDQATDYLIFSVDELDQRALERLYRADGHQRGAVDSYEQVEREQEEMDRRKDERLREAIGDVPDRLLSAIKADGIDPRAPLTLPVKHHGNHRRRLDA